MSAFTVRYWTLFYNYDTVKVFEDRLIHLFNYFQRLISSWETAYYSV